MSSVRTTTIDLRQIYSAATVFVARKAYADGIEIINVKAKGQVCRHEPFEAPDQPRYIAEAPSPGSLRAIKLFLCTVHTSKAIPLY